MSKTPGDSEGHPAVPVADERSPRTFPLADDTAMEALSDADEVLSEASRSFADDPALLAREAAAARAAGEDLRADALLCAQALRAVARGDTDEALSSWSAAFDNDPSLLLGFWGLRAALSARGAWPELAGVLVRRIQALGEAGHGTASDPFGARNGDGASLRALARADLWLSHGRLLEDRLGLDDDAVRSYRAGLTDAPQHAGLLLALLILGWRRGNAEVTVEALTGILRLPLPPAARAFVTAALARIERATESTLTDAGAGEPGAPGAVVVPVSAAAAARALETLRGALKEVGPAAARPLVAELTALAQATSDPAVLAEILGELVAHVSGIAVSSPARPSDLTVPLLRERARLLREGVGDGPAAGEALRQALARAPGHPLVIADLADLADLAEQASAGSSGALVDDSAARLGELLDLIAPGASATGESEARAIAGPAEREVALRYVVALGRGGRAAEGLAYLRRHPELREVRPGDPARADVDAIELALAALAGDAGSLAALFEAAAARATSTAAGLLDGVAAAAERAAAAHALVVTGTLRERAAAPIGDPLESYARALVIAPDSEIAGEALERRLRAIGAWRPLAARWEARLRAQGDTAPDAPTRARLLEELVALHRDTFGDLAAAARAQDQLQDQLQDQMTEKPVGGASADARASLRRLHIALLAEGDPVTGDSQTIARLLRKLGDLAGTSALRTALHVEAAWTHAARGANDEAEAILRATLSSDATGMSGSGLERLPSIHASADASADASARAEIVRVEVARSSDPEGDGVGAAGATGRAQAGGNGRRASAAARALRFRLAHHLSEAGRAREAIEALEPLRSAGDDTAAALVWEIARRSGNANLETAVLEAATADGQGPEDPDGQTDLGEARERAGDFPGAAEAYRRALRAAPSADAALGLFRVGSVAGDAAVVVEASRALGPFGDEESRLQIERDREMLSILGADRVDRELGLGPGFGQGLGLGAGSQSREVESASMSPTAGTSPGLGHGPLLDASSAPAAMAAALDDETVGVLAWVRGVEGGDPVSVSAGLLALARVLPAAPAAAPPLEGNGGLALQASARGEPTAAAADRAGLLVRAATRARLGGPALSAAVHDQAHALSGGMAAIEVGLSDLPVAGRPARAAARAARAARSGGRLAYALHLEVGLDAERRGDATAALAAFMTAASLDPSGIEALDGVRRAALAAGNRRGAAQAGARLGQVVRGPARAALELRRAAELWSELGMTGEAKVAYWHALAREPGSGEVFSALHDLLRDDEDHEGLDRLLGLRLQAVTEPGARLPLLIERGLNRLERLGRPEAALDDFKRSLKIDPAEPRVLRQLANLALARQCHPQALDFLRRLMAGETDPDRRATLRLEMAETYEAARDLPRALEILQEATAEAPADPAARQRLVELFLRAGDWAAAVAALRDWEAVLPDQAARAALWIRIGDLQRDHGRDRRGAEDAYARAARLHPLGEGVFRLAAVHRAAADLPALRGVLTAASAEMRRWLDEDPLNVACLQRLRDLCRLKARGHEGDPLAGMAVGVLGQLLGLLGEPVEPLPGTRPTFATPVAADFWRRLQAKEVEGPAGTVWETIARAAGELLPPAPPHPPPRDKVSAGSEPRLAWIEEAARALGVGGIKLGLAKRPDPNDDSVVIWEGGEASLVVGRGALVGGAAVRFRVGRALWLLHARGAALDRLSEPELEGLFAAAAAAVRGADRPTPGTPDEVAQRARQLVRTMSRKDLKVLEGQASRIAWDQLGAAAFRAGVLRTADRMGLLFAGDLPVALQIVCGKSASQPIGREVIAAEPRALELVRFALGEDYLALRAEAGAGGI